MLLIAAAVLLDILLLSDAIVPDDSDLGGPRSSAAMILSYAAVGFALLVLLHLAPLPVFLLICVFSVTGSLVLSYRPLLILCVALPMVTAQVSGRRALIATMAAGVTSAAWTYSEDRAYFFEFTKLDWLSVEVGYLLFVGVAAGIGWWRQVARRQGERHREEAARAAVNAERRRVARELHDIVAHAVTLMVLQASGARVVMRTNLERADQALGVVEQTGTQAMSELRRLLNVLRSDGIDEDYAAPLGLAALPDLIESVRAANIEVRLAVEGDVRELDQSVDVAAYRVISEALTNVTKHSGPGTTVKVALNWADEQLEVDVTDDGAGSGADFGLSTGNGLLGLTERIVLVGGDFEAHPSPEGGYSVHARFPFAADNLEQVPA